jgi:hypothetical protein
LLITAIFVEKLIFYRIGPLAFSTFFLFLTGFSSIFLIDFKSALINKTSNDIIFVFVDRLGKKTISVFCKKIIISQGLVDLFLIHIYCYYNTPDNIVSDRGL